jgi:hypothetical protein
VLACFPAGKLSELLTEQIASHLLLIIGGVIQFWEAVEPTHDSLIRPTFRSANTVQSADNSIVFCDDHFFMILISSAYHHNWLFSVDCSWKYCHYLLLIWCDEVNFKFPALKRAATNVKHVNIDLIMLQTDLTMRKIEFRSSLLLVFNLHVYFLINCNQNY